MFMVVVLVEVALLAVDVRPPEWAGGRLLAAASVRADARIDEPGFEPDPQVGAAIAPGSTP